ncbi:Hem25p [Lachancea thermotolerans CBS 6340]|uniref:Mitochondrial glycine transporter n=1 Tax=Lachancea thermotolerans (strain ATCC 56472 / CBS 6340 / NRRL Y-8284) TaxID=559295 RepID=C5DMR5_LACTC|nr:KLTH0G11044p [Lachancea thermotolerans CBS 6340]CAR25076.1 KLTH0G11044p [Lachancea thermotolerans CBS 6340]
MSERPRGTSHLVGGFVGGLTSAVVLQPFDLLKTRLQQSKNSNLMDVVHSIKSPKQLWKGTLPSALRTSVGSALFLSTLNIVRSAIADRRVRGLASKNGSSSFLPQLSMYENLLSGAITRAAVGVATMPITVLKVRFESTMYDYSSLGEAARHIYKSEGIRGLFSGCGATILRDAPYAGIYVLFYEQSKMQIPKILPSALIVRDDNGSFSTKTSTIVNCLAAFSSASLATSITAPFDTIKTRMQLNPSKFPSFGKTLTTILKKERPKNLFDGLSLRLTRKALSAGIAWGIYEELVKKFM